MPPATPAIPIPANSSKKRQRDDPSSDVSLDNSVDENGDLNIHLPPSRTPAISPDLVLGQGVSTIDPLTGRQALPAGQTESWFESTLEERLAKGGHVDVPEDQQTKRRRPEASSSTANPPIGVTAGEQSSSQVPKIDEFTHALGIGWAKIEGDPDYLAACRGYCRYIENHYQLAGVDILAKWKSTDSFLINTDDGYYLFNEELTEGRLVAKALDTTMAWLKNLKSESQLASLTLIQPLKTSTSPSSGEDNAKAAGSMMSDAAGDMEMD